MQVYIPEQQQQTTRQQAILQAALSCFIQEGVENTSINMIKNAAQASVGSIYHHFSNKEGIATALYIQGLSNKNQLVKTKLQQATNCEQGIAAIVNAHIEWICDNKDWAYYIYQMRSTVIGHISKNKLDQINNEFITLVSEWFEPYLNAGLIRKLPVEAYVALVLGPVQEYTRNWLSGEPVRDIRQLANVFTDAAWHSIKFIPE